MHFWSAALMLISCLVLAGCGQKGELYLPDPASIAQLSAAVRLAL